MAFSYNSILKKVKPSKKEILGERQKVSEIIKKINSIEGKHVDVIWAGSSARETHLRGDRDLDIFILFEKKLSKIEFEKEGLRLGKLVFRGHKWEKAYSSHPYIRGEINGFKVEIVPSYKIDDPSKLQSAVDRTPFHAKYMKEKFKDDKTKDEVRLLRQFLKGIGAYGADLKISSFPGYAVEIMILKYGSFEKTLKAVSKWQDNQVVDLEKHYTNIEAYDKFKHHLIFVDPIDKNRNVTSAVSLNQFSRFIAASREFLKNKSEKYFFKQKTKIWNVKKVDSFLKKKELIGVKIAYPKGIIADVMWGQLKRLAAKIERQLIQNDFRIFRSSFWTDESELMIIIIELENVIIQKIHKSVGPLITDSINSQKFLESHKNVQAGPRVENGKWVLEIPRKYYNAITLINDNLKNFKKDAKKDMKKAMNKQSSALKEVDLLKIYNKNKEFSKFLTEYLDGKEIFLKY